MKKLYIEICDTYLKREAGLMHRKTLAQNNGMLFKFPYSNPLSFWMKNTYIPLDIAFLDNDGTILQIEEMIPLSTKAVSSRHSCKYALEVNKGWFKSNGIKIGDKIGGEGISSKNKQNKTAAIGDPNSQQPTDPNAQQQPQNSPPPDVMLAKTMLERLQNANEKKQDIIIEYVTKEQENGDGGFNLPPKTISPPFEFEENNTILRAFDKQDPAGGDPEGKKTFIIDNIISIQEKEDLIEGNPINTKEQYKGNTGEQNGQNV